MNRLKIFLCLIVAVVSAFFCVEKTYADVNGFQDASGVNKGEAICEYAYMDATETVASTLAGIPNIGKGYDSCDAGICHDISTVYHLSTHVWGENNQLKWNYRFEFGTYSTSQGAFVDNIIDFDFKNYSNNKINIRTGHKEEDNNNPIANSYNSGSKKFQCPSYACVKYSLGTAYWYLSNDSCAEKFNKIPLYKSAVDQSKTSSENDWKTSEFETYVKQNTGNNGDPDSLRDWAVKYEQLTAEQQAIYDNLCNVISEDTKKMIQSGVVIICIIGVLIFLVITMFEFIKGLVSSDDGRLSNLLKRLKVRIICIVVLLLLPVIVTGVINIVNDAADGIFGEQDPLCDVIK